MTKLCLTLLGFIAMAVLVSARDNEEDSRLTEDLMASARLVRSSGDSRARARKARKSRRGKKGRKGKEERNGANRNIDKTKNNGKKNNNKSELSKKKFNKQIESLTAFQEYKKATNQKKKANRIKGWFRMLAKKVNNSRTFFLGAAEFFKDCPEALSLYKTLR